MALGFLNRCGFRAASSGTGSFVVDSALTGMQAPEAAASPAVVDGNTYRYFAESDDRSQWEYGLGVYTTSDDTLTRATVQDNSSGGTTAISFSAAPKVFMGCASANEVAFRGSEAVTTDSGTPATADTKVFITYVTTDGSGVDQQLNLPTLDENSVGLHHLIILQTQTDPSDLVVVGNLNGLDESLDSVGAHVLAMCVGESWITVAYRVNSTQNPAFYARHEDGELYWAAGNDIVNALGADLEVAYQSLQTNSSGTLAFRNLQPNDIVTESGLSSDGGSCDVSRYTSYVESAGTQGVETFDIPSGYPSGHRHNIEVSLIDPVDVPTLDPSNIETEAGAQPSSIAWTANGSILLEWRQMRDSEAGKWVIIEASSGVVTL